MHIPGHARRVMEFNRPLRLQPGPPQQQPAQLALGDIRLPCGTGLPERPTEPNKSIDSTVLKAVIPTAPIPCRTRGTGEESVHSAHFLSTWLYVYFPIVMGLLKRAGGRLPPRHDFAVRFGTVLMGSPSLLPVAGGTRKKAEPAIDPAAGKDFSPSATRAAPAKFWQSVQSVPGELIKII